LAGASSAPLSLSTSRAVALVPSKAMEATCPSCSWGSPASSWNNMLCRAGQGDRGVRRRVGKGGKPHGKGRDGRKCQVRRGMRMCVLLARGVVTSHHQPSPPAAGKSHVASWWTDMCLPCNSPPPLTAAMWLPCCHHVATHCCHVAAQSLSASGA
jgi:hypothetical protein